MTATAATTPARPIVRESLAAQRERFLLLWIVPIAALAAASQLPDIFKGGGVFECIAAGRWMLAHGAVPHIDPLSFTHAGQAWSPHAWLADAALAAARSLAGWPGVLLLAGLATCALATIAAAWVSRWLPRNAALASLAVGAAFVAPGLGAGPLTLALPLLAAWTVGLIAARRTGHAPSLWLIVLMGVWANLDASAIVGLAIAAALALEALLAPRDWTPAALTGWAAFLLASVVAAMATPFGLDSLTFAYGVLDPGRLQIAARWPAPDFFNLGPLEVALLAGVFGLFWRGAKLTAVRAAILIGLTHLALQHLRQEALLGVVAPLLAAEPLGRTLGRTAPAPLAWRLPAPQMALGAGLAAIAIVWRLVMPAAPENGANAPIAALAQVPPSLRAQPVIDDADFGDYLLFAGVKPFVDGRTDMWGADFLASDDAIQKAVQPTTDDTLAHDGVTWALLRPSRALVAALESEGWRQVYADRFAILLEAPATPSPPLPAPAPQSSAGG